MVSATYSFSNVVDDCSGFVALVTLCYTRSIANAALIFVMHVIPLMVNGSNDLGGNSPTSLIEIPEIPWHTVDNKGVKIFWLNALNTFVMIAHCSRYIKIINGRLRECHIKIT